MQHYYIIANWKMNTNLLQAARLCGDFISLTKKSSRVRVILCPSFSGLEAVRRVLNAHSRNDIAIGAQDCFWEMKGSYTGEESLDTLSLLGCNAVLIGHSERRNYLGETDAMVARKVSAVLECSRKIIPVVCIGETYHERKSGSTYRVLRKQLHSFIRKKTALTKQCIIAYEPVWSISPGRPCSPRDCRTIIRWVRNELSKRVSRKELETISLVYGGSVTAINAANYIQQSDINGILIGQASLQAQEFARIHSSIASL